MRLALCHAPFPTVEQPIGEVRPDRLPRPRFRELLHGPGLDFCGVRMPKNWGRLVSATLSESVKLASVSERCGFVYCLMLPHHDGEGRIPVDEVSLVDLCGRCAIVHGWTLEKMPAIREEIGRAGLWRVYTSARGGLAAEVVDWWKHQRMDKIRRGSDLMAEGELPHDHPLSVRLTAPTSPVIGANVGSLNARISVGSKDKRIKDKGTQEPARARMSEEDARNDRGRPPPESSCQNFESVYQRPKVLKAIRGALGRDAWNPSNLVNDAIERAAASFSEIPEGEWLAVVGRKLARVKRGATHRVADALELLIAEGADSPARVEPTNHDEESPRVEPRVGTWRQDLDAELAAEAAKNGPKP